MELPNLSNKKLDNLSSEDLFKALQTTQETANDPLPLPDNTPPVLEFIQRFKLQSGPNKIESRLLWNLYLQYYPATITRNVFTEMANKILRYDKATFHLSQTSEYLASLFINSGKTTKRVTSKMYTTHLTTYIEKTVVSIGEHKMPWFALYHHYRCYCIDNNIKKPRGKTLFLTFMSLHFKKTTSNDGTLYLVDKHTAHSIPKEDYERLKKLYQKENYTKR